MPPARTDYQVHTLAGRLLFTSDDAGIAERWAQVHCPPDCVLVVSKITTRSTFHRIVERAA